MADNGDNEMSEQMNERTKNFCYVLQPMLDEKHKSTWLTVKMYIVII